MPVIRDISLSTETRDMLRQLGLGGAVEIRPEIRILIWGLLADNKMKRC